MEITARSHPKLHAAFILILQDCGAINRDTPEREAYAIPPKGERLVEAAERGLASLDFDDFCDLAYGEMDDALAISRRSPDLKAAHDLLDLFFKYDPDDSDA